MLSNYVIPVITCGLQQQFSLCVASLCFLRRKQDKLFQTTQLFLLINKFLLFPAATCFVFYTKTVFSLNYYYIGHSRWCPSHYHYYTGSEMWHRIFFNKDTVTKPTTDAHKCVRVSCIINVVCLLHVSAPLVAIRREVHIEVGYI